MTHFIDLTTEQLYNLKELLTRTRQLKDVSKKLDLHISVAELSKSKK
jgi:hypothetical protein